MKIENPIGWTDATTNAVTGCDKVSPGCKSCYAESGTRARVLRAKGIETWGPKGQRAPVNFEPMFRRLNKLCVCDKCHDAAPIHFMEGSPGTNQCPRMNYGCVGRLRRIRLFADSNSDWLDDKWPVETLARFLDAIRLAPNVNVQLLTKRIENFTKRIGLVIDAVCEDQEGEFFESGGDKDLVVWLSNWLGGHEIPRHVWIGVSVEDQPRADKRIHLLMRTPASVRFLSVEPLLDHVNLQCVHCTGAGFIDALDGRGHDGSATAIKSDSAEQPIDWVIVGGESGKRRRDCGVEAIVGVARQCSAAGVPCYVKQDVAFRSGQQGRIPNSVWAIKQFPC